MSGVAEAGALHPTVLMVLAGFAGLLIVANAILGIHVAKHFKRYKSVPGWPQVAAKADNVQVIRVISSRDGAPGSQSHQEAVISLRYRVDGMEHVKRVTRSLAGMQDGQRLKQAPEISLFYNPDDPQETFETPPGPAPFVLVLAGLVVVNMLGWPTFVRVMIWFGEAG